MLAKHALSQLSYGPMTSTVLGKQALAKPKVLLAATAAPSRCEERRPEAGLQQWWAWEDLNLRPHAYQARALTN